MDDMNIEVKAEATTGDDLLDMMDNLWKFILTDFSVNIW